MYWLMLAFATWMAGPDATIDETGSLEWQPRDKAIVVEPVADSTSESKGSRAIRVHGRIDANWNYACTREIPIEAGKCYRLSAKVRVDRLGPGTPMPYLKCEFVATEMPVSRGRAHTERYAVPLGKWETLVGEFTVPKGVQACWLALEKGTSGPAEIDAILSEVRLEPIPRLTVLERYRLEPIPAPLEKLRGIHPRIYLSERRIAELREAIKGSHAESWQKVREQADRAVKRGPPAYRERDDSSGEEQLWQRDVGNTLPVLAMAYAITGEKSYLTSTQQWALASCHYPTWGLGSIDGMDLAAGHQLLGLALVYDWCYRDLEDTVRQEIRQTLIKRTEAMFEAAATGKIWWHESYLQNHLWVNIAGMAVSGLVLFDEVEEAACWIGLPQEKFKRTMAALGPDGASHEGVGYWEYGVEYMLKFMDPARTLLECDLYEHDWWRNTSAYALYLSLPRNTWRRDNCIVDIADCPRGHWYGPDYMLRELAGRFGDGHAQWLAREIDKAEVAASGASWLNLVWYDPAVSPQSPESLPTLRHFVDMGIVSARSDWSGNESLVVFKCGPFIGHQGMDEFAYDPGGGHVHPDANHFTLFGGGQWLIRDDGYHPKWTRQHNTLLINGRGQLGEGAQWFQGSEPLARMAKPTILRALSTPTLDHCVGDATAAYPAELGLKRFVRHVLFVKPDVLIVLDDIAAEHEADLELSFHPEEEAVRHDAAFVAQGQHAVLRIEPLTPEGSSAHADRVELAADHGHTGASMFAVKLTTHQSQWRNAVAFSWSSRESDPVRVSLKVEGERWSFSAPDRTVTFDWSAGKVE